MGSLANSEDPGEMQHNASFHLGLHCLLRLKQPSGTEIYRNFLPVTPQYTRWTIPTKFYNVALWKILLVLKWYMSSDMRFLTMWYVPPAKTQISLGIHAV